MQFDKNAYRALLITAIIHLLLIALFAYVQIDFNSKKDWSYINMSLREIESPKPTSEIEKVKIPKNFEEKGLDAKKYSVAKTNQAVNEATNELSNAEKAALDQQIAKQIEDMARNESTTDLGRKGAGSLEGSMSEDNGPKKRTTKEKGDADLGNKHDESTNITYFLKNRTEGVIGIINPIYVCQGGGKVVVNITVNRFGEVTAARINTDKTETKDKCLHNAAEQAALTSTFNEDMQATEKQFGTITYNFIGQ